MQRFRANLQLLFPLGLAALPILLIGDLRGWQLLQPTVDAAWHRLLRDANGSSSDDLRLLRRAAAPDSRGTELVARCLQSSRPTLRRAARTLAHEWLDDWLRPGRCGNLPMATCLLSHLSELQAAPQGTAPGVLPELARRVLLCACQTGRSYPDELLATCESILTATAPPRSSSATPRPAGAFRSEESSWETAATLVSSGTATGATSSCAFEDQFALPGGSPSPMEACAPASRASRGPLEPHDAGQ